MLGALERFLRLGDCPLLLGDGVLLVPLVLVFFIVLSSFPVPRCVVFVFAMMQTRAQMRRCGNRAGAVNCLGHKDVGPLEIKDRSVMRYRSKFQGRCREGIRRPEQV
mgnify:CR=1 FL=1